MEKIKKMIESYNKTAQKWGFDEIEIINGKISKDFSEKTTYAMGFFKKIKIIFQNGYMEDDYQKIKKALSEIKLEEPKTDDATVEDSVLTLFKKTVKYDKTIEEDALKNTFKH